MKNKVCPICEMGQLHAKTEWFDVEHLGHTGKIKSHYAECDACGSEQAGTTEARLNKRAMIAFKKEVQGLLTGEQVRVLRKTWGLSQEQAAKVFGGGPVAFSKYEKDDVMQSDSMDRLLRMAEAFPMMLEKLIQDAGVSSNIESVWEAVQYVDFSVTTKQSLTVVRSHSLNEKVAYGY
ncbi:hypothetical protein MACH16_00290 [Marinomonas pontica]|uniref:Type II toxin-antitoxin system MqsA family antitoxin n=1 Tax=Marinomonas pontica TaxID=264739 RepID=A0ABM8FB85_9GAMM|nr:hypothetical protein MACH16_00290 [Marinomonas pontica]